MALTLNLFNCFTEDMAEKVHNLGSDTQKFFLTNSAPIATNTTTGDLTEITAEHGYSAGGVTFSVSTSAQTSGTYKLVHSSPTLTASSGTIGPYRYIVWNNSTANRLIGWYDISTNITLQDGESYVFQFDGTNGTLQLVPA